LKNTSQMPRYRIYWENGNFNISNRQHKSNGGLTGSVALL
jgi:hypothetical protein